VRHDDPVTTELVLPDPWWDLRGDGVLEAQQRHALTAELAAELAQGHPLHGQALTVVAQSQASDDVLVAFAGAGWAIVHLTWSHKAESPPWPLATYHPTPAHLQHGLQQPT